MRYSRGLTDRAFSCGRPHRLPTLRLGAPRQNITTPRSDRFWLSRSGRANLLGRARELRESARSEMALGRWSPRCLSRLQGREVNLLLARAPGRGEGEGGGLESRHCPVRIIGLQDLGDLRAEELREPTSHMSSRCPPCWAANAVAARAGATHARTNHDVAADPPRRSLHAPTPRASRSSSVARWPADTRLGQVSRDVDRARLTAP